MYLCGVCDGCAYTHMCICAACAYGICGVEYELDMYACAYV